MGIKSIVIQCLKHSDFISALSMPEKFDFNNKPCESTCCYENIRIQTRITLYDVSLKDEELLVLYGNFITIEDKYGCGSDLLYDIPNSSTSNSVRGQFETTIHVDEDLINMVTEFAGSGYQYGANRDNYRLHDPLYSKVIHNGTSLDVFGCVKEVYKVADEKFIHTSSISDNTEVFDIDETEEQVMERDYFEIYPKGIVTREYMAGRLVGLAEEKSLILFKDRYSDINRNYDSTDFYSFIEREKPKKEQYIEKRNKAREKKRNLIKPASHKKENPKMKKNSKRR